MIRAVILSLLAIVLTSHVRAAEPTGVIHCWDKNREIVQPKRLHTCDGEVVDSQKAAQLTDQYRAARIGKMARSEAVRHAEAVRPFRFVSAGSAFAFNANGDLMTSAHVIEGCDGLEARLPGRPDRLRVAVRALNRGLDLAVLRLSSSPSVYLKFSPEMPDAGEPVALIGYPKEGAIRVTPNLTPVMMAGGLRDEARALIGVEGDVRRGHSGGPALDSRGRVVGVVKAKIDTVAAHQLTGMVVTDLGMLVEPRAVQAFLTRIGAPFEIDRDIPNERSGEQLFDLGSAALARIDCLKRR